MGLAEDGIPRFELSDISTDLFNHARHIQAGDGILGLAQPGAHQAHDVGKAGHYMPDIRMDRSRVDAYQHLTGSGHGPGNVSQAQNLICRAVSILHNRLHCCFLRDPAWNSSTI